MKLSSFKVGLFLIPFVFNLGCAHVQRGTAGESSDIPAPKSLAEDQPQDTAHLEANASDKSVTLEDGQIFVQGIKLKNSKFDYPVTVNSRVEYWIDYFCGKGRGFFQKYLERSEFFIPYIVPLLKQNKLPEDLVYLAMIESGFNNLARSHAKAVGPWQFISATGKRYGLMVNWWIDERRDIRKSTLAAVEYLRDLNRMFKSWELAAAAYNAGETKIVRAIKRYGTKDFWALSRHRFLRPETRDYVPKIIAAALISKNRGQFGFPEQEPKAGAGEAVAGDGEVVKLEKEDKPAENGEYNNQKAADAESTTAMSDLLAEDEDDDSNDSSQGILPQLVKQEQPPAGPPTTTLVLAKPVPTPHLTKKGEVGGEELTEFEVQSPADLLKVARAAGLSYQTVKSLNPEILRWCTPPSVGSFRIKLPSFTKDKFLATYNHQAFPRKVQFLAYKVRRGETLARIASYFGIKVDPMSDLNRISPRVPLRTGASVLLPMPTDRSRTMASLEVRDPPEHRRAHRRHSRHRVLKASLKGQRSAKGSSSGRVS